jgi:hypothetical protein
LKLNEYKYELEEKNLLIYNLRKRLKQTQEQLSHLKKELVPSKPLEKEWLLERILGRRLGKDKSLSAKEKIR